ncbi:sensor histidine kinase [Clostridium sp. UBA6640]|uniref:sensor histidine kinase n=1 Tax=Clostridium sp. UBA6640 TaxID=1946370 RepID=UPI0025BA8802|nr:sensor histidine kinase [Clostridium sp. UBA6640]
MNIYKYLKENKYFIYCQIVILIILNLFIYSNANVNKVVIDILYINFLVISVFIVYIFISYKKWNTRYRELKKLIMESSDIGSLDIKGESSQDEIIRDILILKDRIKYDEIKSLKENIDEIDEYISKWIHEIKIPISICDLITDRLEDIEASRNIKNQMDRINFLVNQVLYSTRANSYSEDLLIQELSLEKLVREGVKKNSYYFITNKIDLELGNLEYNVLTDKKWILYILDQMINNAIKYSREDGKVEIYSDEDEKIISLHVRDNGIGILQEDIERVFNKGYTGTNGRAKTYKSTGMGLYFSKKIADKLGHKIEVTSKENEFTEFTISFYKISDYFNITKM